VRVAQVCPYSLSVPGGVQSQVLGLARALRALGHDTSVLAPCDGDPPDVDVIPLGASLSLASNGSIAPIAPDPVCALRTVSALQRGAFDVIHLHEPLAPGPTLAVLVAGLHPVVGTFHRSGKSRAYSVLGPLVRLLAGRLDRRCAVSPDARSTVAAATGGEFVLVPNGIEIDRFAQAPPWPTEGPTIFFVGRHEPRKGLSVLLDAIRLLPPETRLWVAGTGPETALLRQRASRLPGVEWLGPIDDAEKASRLRGAHAFCAPSIGGESFGVVLLEAMAARTPIVATELPAYRAVARSEVDAVLVPPGDPCALAGALRRVLFDGNLADRLTGGGVARAEEFSMDRMARQYLELYCDLHRR
jgi:phosphatidyl-myo-inositol alpha-mannosyltransferase